MAHWRQPHKSRKLLSPTKISKVSLIKLNTTNNYDSKWAFLQYPYFYFYGKKKKKEKRYWPFLVGMKNAVCRYNSSMLVALNSRKTDI